MKTITITIAKRITLMICTSVGALILVGFIGISVANKGTESIRKINDESMASIQTLADARQIHMEIRVSGYLHLSSLPAARWWSCISAIPIVRTCA